MQVLNGYELSGERTSAITKMGNRFSATAVALLDVSKISELDKEKLEGIIEKTGKPFKLVTMVNPINRQR